MTKFNPKNKETLTFGEALGPAMEITDQADADQYKAAYIQYQNKFLVGGVNESGQTSEQIANINLGYYAGYYNDETRKRVERLFKTQHPVFGAIKQNGQPTAEEALECGKTGSTLKEIRTY